MKLKLLFTCVSGKVKNTRIQRRSPWPSRPYDPPAHGGIRSGLSFPPSSPLCGADACRSATHREQILHRGIEGPLPVCCLCRVAPLVCFQCPWGKGGSGGWRFSITKEGTWMVALLVWGALLVHLYNHHHCKRPKATAAKSSPAMLISSVGLTKQTKWCLLCSSLYLSGLQASF